MVPQDPKHFFNESSGNRARRESSGQCSAISSKRLSGACKSWLPRTINLRLVESRNSAAIKTFASMTSFRGSPGTRVGFPLVFLPNGVLDLSAHFLNITPLEGTLPEEGIEAPEVLELLAQRLAGDLAPTDLRVLPHFLVKLVGNVQGEVGH